MSRHELWTGNTPQAPRHGISMFRGRSGAGSLLQPEQDRLPAPLQRPPLGTPLQRPPLPRQPITKKALAGTLLGVSLLLGIIWFCSQSTGQSAYWDHNMRGNADYHQGDYAAAVSEYGQMIQINPQRQDGYFLQGMAYHKMEQYRLAAQDYRSAMALTSPDPILYRNLGYVENGYGDPRQAIRDFSEALNLDPTIPDQPTETADAHDGTQGSVKGRMWAYYDSGQYALALKDCDALIAVHPYPASIAVRGKLYAKMGDYKSSLRDFETALNENPRLQLASEFESTVFAQMHQFKAAAAVREAEALEYPNDTNVLWSLGWWQYRAGEMPQAIATDQKALALNSQLPVVLNNLGLTYAAQEDWKNAEPAYKQSLRISHGKLHYGALVDVQSALLMQPHSTALHQALVLLRSAQAAAK